MTKQLITPAQRELIKRYLLLLLAAKKADAAKTKEPNGGE